MSSMITDIFIQIHVNTFEMLEGPKCASYLLLGFFQPLNILVNVFEKGYLGLRQEKEMRKGGSVAAFSIADPTVLIVAPPR